MRRSGNTDNCPKMSGEQWVRPRNTRWRLRPRPPLFGVLHYMRLEIVVPSLVRAKITATSQATSPHHASTMHFHVPNMYFRTPQGAKQQRHPQCWLEHFPMSSCTPAVSTGEIMFFFGSMPILRLITSAPDICCECWPVFFRLSKHGFWCTVVYHVSSLTD